MSKDMIPLFKVGMSKKLDSAVSEVLHSGFVGQGDAVDEFEQALAERIGNPYVLTVAAGTHALHLALILAGVEPGDEVITSPLTCTATNWPILYQGAKPIWCDIDPETGNIDPGEIESLITDFTKAIMVVHWGGYPCDMDRIGAIAKRYGIPIIEDAAHAFGATYKGNLVGMLNYTAFSFQAIKHLNSVDGGALFVEDEAVYERGKLLRWYGIDREENKKNFRCEDNISEWGYKYHMNNVAATIGLANLKRIDAVLKRHRQNARYYNDELSDTAGITLLRNDPDILSSYWIYTMKVENQSGFEKMMADKRIMVSRVHERNDKHSCVSEFKRELPQLDQFVKEMICIPCGWWVSREDREYIVESIQGGW